MPGTKSIWKKLALSLIVTVGFFVLLEAVLTLVGVRPVLFEEDPYVGFSSTSPLFVEGAGSGGAELVTAANKGTLFNRQRFPADKGDAFRIFCVGGSTTYGRPYDDATSFCGWLRELLPAADPGRRWEVINAGGISYASYRVAILMEELAGYSPDLFVVYSGHNEFLERRTYPQIIAMPRALRGVGAVAARTRTWAALTSVLRPDPKPAAEAAAADGRSILAPEVTTILDEAVGPAAYSRDDELAAKILQHYRFNLARMVDIAGSAGADILFVTPASNLRDSRPFKSEHRDALEPEEEQRFRSLVEAGARAHREGRMEISLEAVEAAVAIDPRHAQVAYLQGRLLAEMGRWAEARAAFERARDEDVCPLRALGPMPGIVREVASERAVPVVDFAALADRWAEHGIPGDDLFLDHVHPTIDSNRRLAVAIVEELAERGIVSLDASWGEARIAEVAERVASGLDPHDHATALMNLSKVLGWAGKLGESYRLARQAVELFPDDSLIQYNAGLTAHLIGRKDEAVPHYRRAVELQPDADEPHGNLGVLLEEAGRLDEAIDHYRLAIRHARTPETARRNTANLAKALMQQGYEAYSRGRLPESLESLREAAGLAPGDPEILGRLGIAQLAAGQTGAALASFTAALEARPDSAPLTNRLALALALDGQVDRAAATYARALEMDPSVAELPDNMFRVLEGMGRADLASQLRAQLPR
jgi:tetratricopeptide (TPR) repeat protein